MRYDPLKMYVISTWCSGHNAEIYRCIGLFQNVITRWILKITQQYFGFIHYTCYNLYSSMSNCFWGHRYIFIFDPKCKLSDTPDCDWHVHVKTYVKLISLSDSDLRPSSNYYCCCELCPWRFDRSITLSLSLMSCTIHLEMSKALDCFSSNISRGFCYRPSVLF